jgi:phage terminase large subunit GpA-like protein
VGFQKELWIIQKHKLYGDPKGRKVWVTLDEVLSQKFTTQQNKSLKLLVKFVDSGYLSQEVYDYCRGREIHNGYWPIKGARQPLAPILPRKWNWVDNNRTRSLTIGVNKTKEYIFERLKLITPGPRFIHFDQSICDHEYFEQLTAEHGVKKQFAGVEIMHYVKKASNLRNESLDLFVYVVAAVEFVNPNWETLKKKSEMWKSESEKPVPQPEQKPDNLITKPVSVKKIKHKVNSITNW